MSMDTSRVSLYCQFVGDKPHWVTMDHCDKSMCPFMDKCGEYVRLNKSVYNIEVEVPWDLALPEEKRNQAHQRIRIAANIGGSAAGISQEKLEERRAKNQTTDVTEIERRRKLAEQARLARQANLPAVIRTPATPTVPRRPKLVKVRRPRHEPTGRGKPAIGGRDE